MDNFRYKRAKLIIRVRSCFRFYASLWRVYLFYLTAISIIYLIMHTLSPIIVPCDYGGLLIKRC